MKYLRFSRSFQQRRRVLLLLILFMFCHFVRLSALSFSPSRFNNIYNITKGKRALPWSRVGNVCPFLEGIGKHLRVLIFFFSFFCVNCCLETFLT